MLMQKKIKVFVVDDSMVFSEVIVRGLSTDPTIGQDENSSIVYGMRKVVFSIGQWKISVL